MREGREKGRKSAGGGGVKNTTKSNEKKKYSAVLKNNTARYIYTKKKLLSNLKYCCMSKQKCVENGKIHIKTKQIAGTWYSSQVKDEDTAGTSNKPAQQLLRLRRVLR